MNNRLLVLLTLVTIGIPACSPVPGKRVSETRESMGTVVTITAVSEDRKAASEAVEEAFSEIDRLESLLSTYEEQSEISRLNRVGNIDAGADLLAVLERALHFHQLSGGAFDITAKPLLDLYQRSFSGGGSAPSDEQISELLPLIDAQQITFSGTMVSLPDGAELTVDGIAKGYIVDRAIEVLHGRGVKGALINAGGDIRVYGPREDGGAWNIALQNPRAPADNLFSFPLREGAVATSGDYRRYYDPQRKHHHILDPRSGRSATGLISVSVIAPTAMDADALATGVFVLGPEAGLRLIESLAGAEAFLVTAERQFLSSSGWR